MANQFNLQDQPLFTGGSYSGTGTATLTFTVTIGFTMSNPTYKVQITPTTALAAVLLYVTNKTATSFDVTFISALTGTVGFDYLITP